MPEQTPPVSMEEVIDRNHNLNLGMLSITESQIKAAMSEWASIQCAEKDRDIANLKTVMVAAAEEIQEHWQAHCDEEGYGPSSLLRRLEQGIPVEYGYTAGRFAELVEELATKEEAIKELETDIEHIRRNAEKINEHTWKVYKEQILAHAEQSQQLIKKHKQ